MSIVYLTLEQAVEVHRKTVEISGGGALGSLDLGKLKSVLQHMGWIESQIDKKMD